MSEREESAVEAAARVIVSDRLTYYGYTPGEITDAMRPLVHDDHGCVFEGMRWDCYDHEAGKPLHPIHDEADKTAEFVMWVLEHPAVYPLLREGIAAEVLAEVDQMLEQDWSELGQYALRTARRRIATALSTAKEATK